jgi:hypothetical protein
MISDTVVPLDEKRTEALLGDEVAKLRQARENLLVQIAVVRAILQKHPLTMLVADKVLEEQQLRGSAEVRVSSEGEIAVVITHEKRAKWISNLPTLDTLRQEAKELGVDVAPLGRNKTAIIEKLKAARAGQEPRPKRVKTGSPVAVTVVPTLPAR